MPKLYLPLLRAQLIKLEKAFQPGLSTITWTSLEIPAYCENIERVLDEVDLFVKEVNLTIFKFTVKRSLTLLTIIMKWNLLCYQILSLLL